MSARWISRERRARDHARVGVVVGLGQRAPELARCDEQLADLVELFDVAVALVRRVQGEAERAERVLLPREEHRHRHREVLVDARERHRLLRGRRRPAAATARAAARRSRSGSRSPRASRRSAARSGRRCAPCGARAGATAAASRTGSPRHRRSAPAARGGRSSSRSMGLQTEVSKKTPVLPAKWPASAGEVGDACVRDDQRRLRVLVVQAREVVRDRRQPAAAVDEDRHAALRRDREHRREALVVQLELLRARVQLDPARAEVEAALGLLDRAARSGRAARTGSAGPSPPRRTRACGRWRRGKPGCGRARRGRRRSRARRRSGRGSRSARRSGRPCRRCRRRDACARRRCRRPTAGRARSSASKTAKSSCARSSGSVTESESTRVGYSNAGASTRSRKTRSGTAPSHCGTPLTTIRGTAQTSASPRARGTPSPRSRRRECAVRRAPLGTPAARPAGNAVRSA